MYGYRMAKNDAEELDVWLLFASAMAHRAPVRVSYFKQRKYESGPDKGKPMTDAHGYPIYVKITRTVEPYEFGVTKAGKRIVHVVDRSPEGVWGPEYRSIRLDRVAFRFRDGTPVATRMLSHHYMCPSRLDYRELHPTKRVLASV